MLCKHTLQFAASLVIVFATLATAQVPDSLWTRYYNSGESEICFGIDETTDNGLILAGYALLDTGATAVLIKTGPNGSPFWSRTFGDNEQAYCVLQTADGSYLVGGSSTNEEGNSSTWLMKASSTGDSVWSRTFGGISGEDCRSIVATSDGGYLLAGNTTSFGEGDNDAWIVKTDANGGGLWTRTVGSDGSDQCIDAIRTSDNGYVFVGQTDSLATWGGVDAWIVKLNSQGDTLWSRTFGGQEFEFFYSVQEAQDGGYVAAGATQSNSAGSYDFFIAKTDANGNGQWTHTYGDIGDDECSEIRALPDGGFILSGPTGSFDNNAYGTWILRTDALGDTLWSKVIRPDTTGYGFCGILLSDGGYAFAGGGLRISNGRQDMLVTKIGAIPLPVTQSVTPLPSEFALSNFPNPFNPVTTIQFSMPQAGHATLTLFDVNGRQIETLLNDNLTSGEYHVSFDGANLPSGTYFARVQANTSAATHKIVLLK
ncbi:MAG: T9SS type A sorting domain-containing protein [bacterium]|nr:T9SS type A sorting domain-containing protein [bacterium]